MKGISIKQKAYVAARVRLENYECLFVSSDMGCQIKRILRENYNTYGPVADELDHAATLFRNGSKAWDIARILVSGRSK